MDHLHNHTLIELVKQYALKYGDFKLSSGARSHYFIDMSKAVNRSECLDLILTTIYGYLDYEVRWRSPRTKTQEWPCNAVGGPVLGAAPLVGGMLATHARRYYGQGLLRGFLVRKEPKNGELIEGALCPGDNVLILEDVVTTGKQTKRAIEVVEEFGAKVRAVIAVVDRLAGAKELLAPWNFHSMMTIHDLGVVTQKEDPSAGAEGSV